MDHSDHDDHQVGRDDQEDRDDQVKHWQIATRLALNSNDAKATNCNCHLANLHCSPAKQFFEHSIKKCG
ncbi:hypothetical protein M513_03249 [Trichuris suis]|uniref:Uncharacterized protein n=1 Tax=Trichuris suis TaxID=68888 RepID=A0A085MF14_9BILA|nr:hypothetical protein M513_03249 [Trichuris suis]